MEGKNVYKLKTGLLNLFLLLSLGGYTQILIEEPVYMEDFGVIPETFPGEWGDPADRSIFRKPWLSEGECVYSFIARVYHPAEYWPGWLGGGIRKEAYWENTSMDDAGAGAASYYAITANGEKMGGNTWHSLVDHGGNPEGLAFVGNTGKDAGKIFSHTISGEGIKGGNVYRFQTYVSNIEHNFASDYVTTKPSIKAELSAGNIVLNGKSTGELASTESISWKPLTFFIELPGGAHSVSYTISNEKNGTWVVWIYPGNVFAIDDISLSPVKIQASRVLADFCSRPGIVLLEAQLDNRPDDLAVYARLIRQPLHGGVWEWAGEYQDSLKFELPDADYHNYKYRVALALTKTAIQDAALLAEDIVLNTKGVSSVTETFESVYLSETWSNFDWGLKFCEDPALAVFKADPDVLPVSVPVYTRLMQRERGKEGEWAWKNEQSDTLDVRTGALDYLNYEYQLAIEIANGELLDRETPRSFMESDNHGCFVVKNTFRNDFCREVFGVDIDYTQIADSVVIIPQMAVTEGERVYLRWLYRPWEAEEWGWWGESRLLEENRIDWQTFATGDFRAVYAMNPDLLNAMSAVSVGTRDYYYVATAEDAIRGIPLKINIEKRFLNGGVVLKAEPDMPSKVRTAVKGFWLVREKGTESWEKLEGFEQKAGVPEYARYDYRFVASMSQRVIDTLNIACLTMENPSYWLSEIVQGAEVTLEGIGEDYCDEPGNVVLTGNFSSSGIPAEMPAIGRWRWKEKGMQEWSWINNYSGIKPLSVPMEEFLNREYQLVIAWSTDSLDCWKEAGMPVAADYYLLEDRISEKPFCLSVDTIRVFSERPDELILRPEWDDTDNYTVYGRWMRIEKDSGNKEWVSGILTGNYELTVDVEAYGGAGYRLYLGLSPVIFDCPADMLGDVRPYVAVKTAEGRPVVKPQSSVALVTCVNKQDTNRVTIHVSNDSAIRSFRYRIGEGEFVKVLAASENEIGFTIGEDTFFCLESYALDGVCDSIVRNDTLHLSYRPKLQINRFNDLFGCRNSTSVVRPVVSGGNVAVYEWWKDGTLYAEGSEKDSLHIRMTGMGAVPLKLTVRGEDVCPEDSTVFLITGEHPQIDVDIPDEPEDICIGQPFVIPYRYADADQYRITLKETDMPGFVFYPGTGNVRQKENGMLQIKSGQLDLVATDFMAGNTFTFRIQIFKTVTYKDVAYRCEEVFDYRFKVRRNPVSSYPSRMKLCEGEALQLSPQVEINGNTVERWVWQLWDGTALTGTEISVSGSLLPLDTIAGGTMSGKRLRLLATTGCGDIAVQDIRLYVYTADSNRIEGPQNLVVCGDKLTIRGSAVGLPDLKYRWEKSEEEASWVLLKGEQEPDMVMYAPHKNTLYKRSLEGSGWTCPDMDAVTAVKVFDNDTENRIYLEDKDTLVYSGTEVTIRSMAPGREGVLYRWEKNEGDGWQEIEGENGNTLTSVPREICMYRRIAIVGERFLNSNAVVVNVYDRRQNRIFYTGGLVKRESPVRLTGNFMDLEGVGYRWYMIRNGVQESVPGQDGWNLETVVKERTSFVRYVFLPGQPKDSLASNIVTVYVFDNGQDNRITTGQLNVCRGIPVEITGSVIEGEDITYRWEYSYDEGNSWVVTDSTRASLNWRAETDILFRRRVLHPGAEECYSNILPVRVIHTDKDNRIMQPVAVLAGEEGEIEGTEVANASYRWEMSLDGEQGWIVLEGAASAALQLNPEWTKSAFYLRRKLLFPQGEGCEEYSNILKVKVIDTENTNRIRITQDFYCQWASFWVEGTDMADLEAAYRWYKNTGEGWEAIERAYDKDLYVYEGVGKNTAFRRDAIVDEKIYEGNIVEVRLWETAMVRNVLSDPGEICAGVAMEIKGSDAFAGDRDLSGFIDAYSWEKSVTGAGGTWEKIDSAEQCNLFLDSPEVSAWYCRNVTTRCGNNLRSEPVFVSVRDRLPLTLRSDVGFGKMSVKKPVTISVDEDFYDSYTFKIDGRIWKNDGRKCTVYGWQPRRSYKVRVLAEKEGCMEQDSLSIHTPDVDLPDILTPNEDGFNDCLLAGYELKVYNRWGGLLYSGTEGWDGKYRGRYVASGTYFYVIRLRFENGKEAEYKRSVTVKR